MAEPSTWVPHIESFVDASRTSSQHDASLEAIATLVKKDIVSLLEVVREMEMYLTTTDNVIRSRGTLLLGEILVRISHKTLDHTAIDSLSDFFISRLADWVALRGTLTGCHAILCRKKEVGSISKSDVQKFSKVFFEEVDVRSLAANDRKLCYELLICVCTVHKEVATIQGEDLVYDILRSIDDEMDPTCLMLAFQLLQSAMSLFPVLSDMAYQDAFDILSKYFPVYFTHGDASNDATREELSDILLNIFCSSPKFEPHIIPFLLEKLSTSFSLAKLDSLKYLRKCISCYGPDRMADHAEDLWRSLETVIFNKEEDRITKEALECFETAVSVLITPNRDTFFGLICQKIDSLLNRIAPEKQAELHALGSIFAIISRVSDSLCTRVFRKYFARLVNSLVESIKGSLNSEALYLVSEILSSCRGLIQRSPDSTEVISEKVSWLNILRNYSGDLSAALLKLVNAITSLKEESLVVKQENVLCAVKCLEVLATFPEGCSPITDETYDLILKSLALIISEMDRSTLLWKSTLEGLIQIGSVAENSIDRRRSLVYTALVVENLLSAFINSTLPLDLSLEALYGIGMVGKHRMEQVLQVVEEIIVVKILKVCLEGEFVHADTLISLLQFYSGRIISWLSDAGDVSEVAMQFALHIWNQMENKNILKNIHVMGILDALMMTMKHLVSVSTINHQSVILQKSHEIILKSVSCPTEWFATAFQNPELLMSSPSSSVEDLNLISLFASVITAVSAQTPLPASNPNSSSNFVSNLFLFFFLRGHMPAAQALASTINKNPTDNKAIESCLSILSEDKTENKQFFKKDIITGFAWIGKGLVMRGDDRSKEIIQFLLKLAISSQHGLDAALSAADGFHIIMGDSDGCLNKKFHAVIKPLYKQRLYSTLVPVLLKSMKEANSKEVVCRAFGHVISDAPLTAVIGEAHKILLAVAHSIITLSMDIQNKDVVYSLLLVLSGILMDSTGKESIIENLHIVIGVLTQLVSYPHLMLVRETAIQCITSMSTLPHSKIYPVKPQVLKAVTRALDDKRRAVRQEAVRCRQAWSRGKN
ncbi:MMS19 nucleotide excision repair [Rhynchospora pubera]|uniref:MMS19 nucleotide excision repair protein n=1 Tax=Rhynchospora pubera TaxID=906938 RepID=A0AAV8C694_9POAL|nr:MMS19 nucleotide excision repair [Rhynchospora pubera]